ncbi:unnamed protein product [Coffea canephora]|uniref:Leucine-rich repeat-containing N-terminal plant-type domain-containing protein n=2 Tax=Coffea TaxID=13442 RepID=A0A068TLN2_COFCA|nr:uncharacterized protein At4g06744-like [Coffea arabica]CDO97205.1 unnamed protein product [Coffea canephora]
MGSVSSNVAILLIIFELYTTLLLLHNHLANADPIASKARETLEIIIGGGIGGGGDNPSDAPPPDDGPSCPPPVSPFTFESKRIEIVYPVIQRLKAKITCDPLGITKSWVGPDICNKYQGFRCATVPDYGVKALADVQFNGYNFSGPDLTLEGFIDELPDLSIFHGNSNKFAGNIPKKLSTIRYLFELDLSNNNFNGQFPYEVLGATKLTFLDLRFNSFSGAVPPQVFTLDLDVLFINNNNFVQRLPDNLGSLPVLFLTLANNKLTGPIPSSIGKASKTLDEVIFLNNQLTGCLPCEIGLLNKATVFDVSRNLLTGPIPWSFACLAKMEILNLAKNQFFGVVPDPICQLPNLESFDLSSNYFTGVGPECWKLIQRKVLDVTMNCIPGLPNQRSKAECDAFFCKPRSCSNQGSLTWVPCSSKYSQPATSTSPGGRAGISYKALKPHRL